MYVFFILCAANRYSLDSTSARWFIIDSTTGEIKMTLEMARGNGPTDAPNGIYSGIIFAPVDGNKISCSLYFAFLL